jgi:drug/metabolite transporter (DMT)-like permease
VNPKPAPPIPGARAATPPWLGLSPRGLFHLAVVYVVWGSTYLAIRMAVAGPHGFSPFVLGTLRMGLGGGLLLAWTRLRRRPMPLSPPLLLTALVSGVLMWVGGNGLVMVAEQHLPSGYSALMMGTVPIWAALAELPVRRRLSPLLAGALTVGLAGLFLLTASHLHGSAHPVLVLLLVAAALCWAAGMVWQRGRLSAWDPQVSSAWQQIFAAAGFLVLALVTRAPWPHPSVTAVGAALYLIVVGSLLAFTSFIIATRLLPMTVVTTYAYVNPLVAVALGGLVLGERITVAMGLGGALLLLGIAGVLRDHRADQSTTAGESA